jgi:tetratricopeptide (TPR) repeat protein
MRFPTLLVLCLILSLLNMNPILAAQREQALSGRIIFDNSNFTCDHCMVTLLANGVRPVGTSYLDLGGHFSFPNVPRGYYTIRLQIDGFEEVNQPLDTSDSMDASVMVTLVPKQRQADSGHAEIVNVAEFKDLYPKKAVSLFEKGKNALDNKKYEEGIKHFRQALELAPTFYEAHNQLGLAYREVGRADDAEREFIAAHELNSTGVAPLLNLTDLYLDENKPDSAVKASEEAVKANSHSAPAFFSLGVAAYKAAMLDRAETALKRALELAPRMSNVRLMLANVYVKLHRYDNTLEQLNKYIAENPHAPQIEAVQRMRDEVMKASETGRP